MKWEKIRLSDCTVYITDGDHQPAPKSESGIKFIKIKDIQNGRISFDANLFVPIEYYNNLPAERKPQQNDILYSVVGSYGQAAFVNTCEPFCFERNIALLHPGKNIVPRFLFYAISSTDFFLQASNAAIGAAQKLISLSRLKNMVIPYPPIELQGRIADILSAYDTLIENNRKQIKLLEEAAQRLYREWFVDLRFPGYEHTKITDGVPEGWEKSTVAAVSSILRRGISPRYNENGKFVVINQKCIRQTVVSFDESRRQEKLYPEDLNLQDSDTVICSTGAGTLGRVGQIFGNYPDTTLDSHVTLVRAMEGFGKQYLFQSLNSRQTYLMGMGKGSTNQLELSRGTIQDLDIYIPSKKVLNQFEQVAQPIHDKISVISKSILQLQTARDHLLPKLMSGKVEV